MRALIWILWPSFFAAAIAEFVFFAVVDPKHLYWMGNAVEMNATATYSIGFLLFWLMCIGSSLLTYLLLPIRIRSALSQPPQMPEIDLSEQP